MGRTTKESKISPLWHILIVSAAFYPTISIPPTANARSISNTVVLSQALSQEDPGKVPSDKLSKIKSAVGKGTKKTDKKLKKYETAQEKEQSKMYKLIYNANKKLQKNIFKQTKVRYGAKEYKALQKIARKEKSKSKKILSSVKSLNKKLEKKGKQDTRKELKKVQKWIEA